MSLFPGITTETAAAAYILVAFRRLCSAWKWKLQKCQFSYPEVATAISQGRGMRGLQI
jgi:hypothetical protein